MAGNFKFCLSGGEMKKCNRFWGKIEAQSSYSHFYVIKIVYQINCIYWTFTDCKVLLWAKNQNLLVFLKILSTNSTWFVGHLVLQIRVKLFLMEILIYFWIKFWIFLNNKKLKFATVTCTNILFYFTVPKSCRDVFVPLFQLSGLSSKVDKRPLYLANLTSKLQNLSGKKFWTHFWASFLGPKDPAKMTIWAKTIRKNKFLLQFTIYIKSKWRSKVTFLARFE